MWVLSLLEVQMKSNAIKGLKKMNLSMLRNALNDYSIDPKAYSLNGGYKDESYCIENISGIWTCYYCERGKRSDVVTYENESNACEYFLNKLKSDPTCKLH